MQSSHDLAHEVCESVSGERMWTQLPGTCHGCKQKLLEVKSGPGETWMPGVVSPAFLKSRL